MIYCAGTTNFHKPKIILETSEVTKEYCEECKEEFIFKKSRHGRIDQEYYHDIHQREFLQPYQKEFEKEYGNKNL